MIVWEASAWNGRPGVLCASLGPGCEAKPKANFARACLCMCMKLSDGRRERVSDLGHIDGVKGGHKTEVL